jgi:hypothetical protein
MAETTLDQWHLRAPQLEQPALRAARTRSRRWGYLRLLVPLIGLAVGVLSLRTTDLSKIGAYGLIQALPPGYYVGVLIVLASFPLIWGARRSLWLEFPIAVAALVVLIHGAPAIAEPLPRFPSAWLLAGFTSSIADTGRVLPLVDARFSWPSMLAGSAMLTNAGGLPSVTILLQWWPVALNLFYVAAVYVLAKGILADSKRAMLAAWLLPLANWVGQDYYSPQSVAFLLYLVVMIVALGPFGIRPRYVGDIDVEDPTFLRPDRRQLLVLLSGLLIVAIALATGHQLTPGFAAVTVLALAVARRTSLRVFGVLMVTMTLAWVCWGAYAFWSGHIGKVFGELGQLGNNVAEGGTSRLAGTPAHVFVTQGRLFEAALILGLAAIGFLVSRRVRADRLAAAVLTAAPASILAVQSYGGEGGMRVFLMSLPGALCLIALLVTAFPRPVSFRGAIVAFQPRRVHGVAALALSVALVPMFLISRWGNEQFEQTRPDELAAVQALYAMAPPGSTLMSLDLHIPWMFDHVDTYKYKTRTFAELPSTDVSAIETEFGTASSGYLIITAGQVDFAIQTFGLPPDWVANLESTLVASGRFHVVYENPNARIYQYSATG